MVNFMLIEKLGPIKSCNISLGQQTILLGKNNSGKTYASYLLYGMYKRIDSQKSNFLNDFLDKHTNVSSNVFILNINKNELGKYMLKKITEDINKNLIKDLPKIFNLSKEEFDKTVVKVTYSDFKDFVNESLDNPKKSNESQKFSFKTISSKTSININLKNDVWEFTLVDYKNFFEEDMDHNQILKMFLRTVVIFLERRVFAMPNILYIPAERNGINVFRKELAVKRSTKSFDIEGDHIPTAKYPFPIAEYMKYLTLIDMEITEYYSETSQRHSIWNEFSTSILKGKYEYDYEQNEYYYREIYSNKNGNVRYKSKKIPLQIASSSTKSLFGLEYYLKFLFSKGDILFIDEPEMNLDPENQVKIAEILVSLSNLGVKVIISSHSDYLIRATTNKILKSKVVDDRLEYNIQGHYFSSDSVQHLDDLSELDYIEVFDDINADLEETYFTLKNKIANKILKE